MNTYGQLVFNKSTRQDIRERRVYTTQGADQLGTWMQNKQVNVDPHLISYTTTYSNQPQT